MKEDNLLSKSSASLVLIITGIALLFLIPFLGHVHLFDWDEINFAECAREMLVSGNYTQVQINFEPFWEKPPFFFWLQAICMKVFGVNEFAARLPNALFGVITLVSLFLIGKKEKDAKFGIMWVLLYFGSFLPHFYFKSGIIDPVFNLFIFLSVYFFYKLLQYKLLKFALLSGTLSGLAVITKGPVGLLLLGLTMLTYLGITRFKDFPSFKSLVGFVLVFLATTTLWYGVEIIKNGFWFLQEFINYQVDLFKNPVAGHSQPFYYHFVVVLVGCFPMSLFALPKIISKKQWDNSNGLLIVFKCLFWIVLILFSIVTTKIIHYSSMAYLPLSFVAASVLYNYKNYRSQIWNRVFAIVGITIGLILTIGLFLTRYKKEVLPYIKDSFTYNNIALSDVEWSGFEFLIGFILVGGIWFAYRLFSKQEVLKALTVSSLSIASFLLLIQAIVLPKIEQYSQGNIIEYFIENRNTDTSINVFGYKSYAPYFYLQTQQPLASVDSIIKNGGILVVRNEEIMKPYLDRFKLIKRKGGFEVFEQK